MSTPIFKGAFPAREDEEFSGRGKRPVIFDIVAPDGVTSMLPRGLKLVLHVNPNSMGVKYEKAISRTQTKGGFVEYHWGEGARSLDFEFATGGFMRLYSGLSYTTSPEKTGGSRRETLAYDAYLDLLSLFHNNGSVYDDRGQVALQGKIKVTFDGGVFLGWFESFSVTESADKPYQFTMSAAFTVDKEVQVWKSVYTEPGAGSGISDAGVEFSEPPPDPNTGIE